MAMGITQALKLQQGPIDALARLPQDELIKMVQQRRLGADILPVILNEKAQMIQQAANMQAAQRPMPPSVTEQNMAINAQAEAQPMQMAGIANLPLPENMYGQEGYAGGGIVAFDDGGKVQHYQAGNLVRFPSFNELKPVPPDAVVPGSEISSWFGSLGSQDRRIDPVTGEAVTLGEYMRRVDRRRAEAASAALPKPSAPAANVATQPEYRDFKDTDTGVDLTGVAKPAPALPAEAQELSIEDWRKRQKAFGVDDDWIKKVEKLIDKMGESAGDREQAKNLALLQAGLGIMGGSSPYALQNIGEGAKAAVAQYSKDIKDIRAAERDADKLRIEVAKADDARKRGDFESYEKHNERARDYALKLRKSEVDEKVAEAQVKYYGRPGTYEELGQAAERYPWLKERFMSGTENIQMKVLKDAEAFVTNPMLPSQDPKLRDLMKKAKDGDAKDIKNLEAYREELRQAYIRRNMPGGAGAAGAGRAVDFSSLPR